MLPFCRMLNSDVDVELFVENILGINSVGEKREAINLITAAERNMNGYDNVPTFSHKDNRDFEFRDDKTRELLRAQIVSELAKNIRLECDDDICLGQGGAAPKTGVISEKRAYYIIGPPASGKSGISNQIADEVGSYVLDSDYAKRKLPEYKNQVSGASLVHEESDQLIFNYGKGNLLDYCVSKEYNIIIPKIGHSEKTITEFCHALKMIGYAVFLVSVDLDRVKATARAYYRYRETRRYVPLSLVFDAYANEPTLNYFRIKQHRNNFFDGFAQISTDVAKGSAPLLVEEYNMPFLRNIYKEV